MQDFIKYLNSIEPLSPEHLSQIQSLTREFEAESGTYLLTPGVKCDEFFFVKTGLLTNNYESEGGKKFIKCITPENDIASDGFALLEDVPSRMIIQTIEKSTLIAVNFSKFRQLADCDLTLQKLIRKVLEKFLIKAYEREYEFLVMDATQRYQAFHTRLGHIEHRLKRLQVAEYLGITPESLSRITHRKTEI